MEQLGKYNDLRKIGQGAMGEVFKAHDPVLNRFVAIKTVTSTLSSDESFRKRFHREAQSAAQLSHRNIVTIFEFGEEKGLIYMAMELLEGTDLKDLITRRMIPRLDDKLSVIEQICEGLAHAHEKGVIHRDLKPANIHVLPNGTVKIMDFGLARLGTSSDMTRTGTVMGTPNYMSPEQVRGEKADARSDVFSLGALTYELMAGRKPFEADTMHTVLFQVLDQDPEPIRTWVPDLPLSVVQVIERALSKEASRRFQSAGDMRAALRAARRTMAASRAAAVALGAPDDSQAGLEGPTIIETGLPSGARLPTVVGRERRTLVTGSTALDPTRIAPLVPDRELPSTARPETTLHGDEDLEEPAPPGRSPMVWLGVGAVVIGLAVASGLWLRSREVAKPARPQAEIASEQEGILKETLVAGQIELARSELENKDYKAAVAQAQRALEYDPGNAEAQEVIRRAQRTLDDLEASARQAREAFGRGDTEAATEALGRVLAIDPRHPVAGELSAALNQHFRSKAEEARTLASTARAEAEKAKARAIDGFSQSERLVAGAEDLMRKGQFGEATQRFLEAGDGFTRARRAAEMATAVAAASAAAAAARPTPAPVQAAPPSAAPSLVASTAPSQAPAPPLHVPAPPSLSAPSAAPPSAAAPSLTAASGSEPAVRQVIDNYARAIETRDIALFKSVKPDLSSEDEKRLQESFKAIKSHQVGIAVEKVEIEEGKAVVRVARRDTINGKLQREQPQVFRLVQKGQAWTIQSIGQ